MLITIMQNNVLKKIIFIFLLPLIHADIYKKEKSRINENNHWVELGCKVLNYQENDIMQKNT